MNWRRGFFRAWICLAVIWLVVSIWYLDPISQLRIPNHLIVLSYDGNRFEFAPDLPIAEIKKSLVGWAKTRDGEIDRKWNNKESLTADEFGDTGQPPETIASRIIADYRSNGEANLGVARNLVVISFLPPLALLVSGWVIAWVLRGFVVRGRAN
jgi:hypothetical protein